MQSRATTDTACPRYRRVLLKMSGEALEGNAAFGIDHETVNYVANKIKGVREMGVEVAVAVAVPRGVGVAEGVAACWADSDAPTKRVDRMANAKICLLIMPPAFRWLLLFLTEWNRELRIFPC